MRLILQATANENIKGSMRSLLCHFPSLLALTRPPYLNDIIQNHASIEPQQRLSRMYDNNPITFLNLNRLPARVDYHGASILLNFEVVAIKALVEMGHLKAAGNLKGSEHKYFCTKTILKLADDEKWVNDATRAVSKYWAEKNDRRKTTRRDKEPRSSQQGSPGRRPLERRKRDGLVPTK